MRAGSSRVAVLGLLAAGALAAGCGGGGGGERSAAAKGSFVGKVSGTNAYIAVVSHCRGIAGYLCDGKRVSIWFGSSAIAAGRAKLVARQGGRVLGEVAFAAGRASGTVALAGGAHRFSAAPARGRAGLYRQAKITRHDGRLTPGEFERGWIVLADGTLRGRTNVSDPDGSLVTAPAPSSPKGKAVTGTSVSDPDHSL